MSCPCQHPPLTLYGTNIPADNDNQLFLFQSGAPFASSIDHHKIAREIARSSTVTVLTRYRHRDPAAPSPLHWSAPHLVRPVSGFWLDSHDPHRRFMESSPEEFIEAPPSATGIFQWLLPTCAVHRNPNRPRICTSLVLVLEKEKRNRIASRQRQRLHPSTRSGRHPPFPLPSGRFFQAEAKPPYDKQTRNCTVRHPCCARTKPDLQQSEYPGSMFFLTPDVVHGD